MKKTQIPQVAILVSTSNSWGRRIVKGILSYAQEAGPWHIWVKPGGPNEIPEIPRGWRGDGIIARVSSHEMAQAILSYELPIIDVADEDLEDFSAPCVRTDDHEGANISVGHFIDRGFSNFAFAGPTYRQNPTDYMKAFQQSLAQHGHTCESFNFADNTKKTAEKLSKWLHELPKPVGIFVWGNGIGRSVVDTCMEENISVPHDVSILSGGYDELLSHACFPALSGILGPTEQIGYRAAKLLHHKMLGEDVPDETIYLKPLGIMERLSTDTLAIKDPQLVQVVEFLRENAFEPITMDDVIKAVPMARRSLERKFSTAFGHSPIDEVKRIRINKARSLLAETDMQMQEIAEACGYSTYNYLTHVFKQVTGQTPRDYRKQFRTK